MNEYGMYSKEVSLNLEINTNTLRRWSLELEKHGYEFSRNEKEQRIYYDRDILVLSDFKRMIEKTQNLENTAKAVIAKVKDKKNAEKMLSVITEKSDNLPFKDEEYSNKIKSLEETINQQNELLLEVIKKIDLQQKYIEERLNERDNMLMQSLKETLETNKLIAASKEEKKKGFFARLLKK